jgi:hypothetical protein
MNYMLDDALYDMKDAVDMYHINKILSGEGLQDDPEWVMRYEQIIEQHRND